MDSSPLAEIALAFAALFQAWTAHEIRRLRQQYRDQGPDAE